jgi:protein-tyrosine phosphatase
LTTAPILSGVSTPYLCDGSVLVLCTGNVCRSPYLHTRLAALLEGTAITVTSAGTNAVAGSDMDPQSRALLEAVGTPAAEFMARQLTPEQVTRADLIVGAAREHVSAAARQHPRALRRGFALTDLRDLLEGARSSAIAQAPGPTWAAKVAAYAASRRHLVAARAADSADIVDPIGQSPAVFALMARQIETALPVVVAALRAEA